MPCKDRVYFIILQELCQPLIYSLASAEMYSTLQQFLISSPDVSWISKGGGSSPRMPEYAMIDGLARVLRNEFENHRFTTIAFDYQGSFVERQLHSLIQIFRINHINPDPRKNEPEYVQISGELNIPRIVPSPR